MSAVDIVTNFMQALEAQDYDTATAYLADDFIFSGWTPQPLDKGQFMTVMSGLKEGIPNLTYHFHLARNVRDQQELDSTVYGAIQITGKQTDGFILPPLSLPPIPQMDKVISLPEERWNYTVAQNKVARIVVERVAGGGIKGLLHQLGFDVPIIQE